MNLRERVLSNPVVYRGFKRVVLPGGVLERLDELGKDERAFARLNYFFQGFQQCFEFWWNFIVFYIR